jgi:hypothetical protein
MYLIFDLLIERLPIIENVGIPNNYYLTGTFDLFILSMFLFKYNYYKHQIISIIILLVVGLIRYSFIIFESKPFIIDSKSYFILGIFIMFLENICLSFFFVYVKLLIEKYYFSPYKIAYLIGIINGIITLILYLIISFIEMEGNNNSFYLIEYNDKYYIDNIRNVFKGYNFIEILLYIIQYIIYSCIFILFNNIVQYFALGHIIIPNQIIELITVIGEVFFDEYIRTKIKILIFCCFIFEIFLSFVFIEFIELNFCELNKDIKKNISERASSDPNISISSIDNIYEIDNQYIIYDENEEEFDDNKKLEMEKIN